MTTLPRKHACVLDHRYGLGTTKDFSGLGNDGVATNCWWDRYRDRHRLNFTTSGQVEVTDNASIQLTTGTLFAYGVFDTDGNQYLIGKRDAGGTNYVMYLGIGGAKVYLYDGAAVRQWIINYIGTRSVGITFASGSIARGYLDGVDIGNASGTSTITVDDAPLLIGNIWVGSTQARDGLFGAVIYNKILTANEMMQLHRWSDEVVATSRSHKLYSLPGRLIANADVAYWELGQIRNGQVGDITPASTLLTFPNGGEAVAIPGGRGVRFNDLTTYAESSALGSVLTTDFSVVFDLIDQSAGNNNVLLHPSNDAAYPDVRVDTNVLKFQTGAADSISVALPSNQRLLCCLTVADAGGGDIDAELFIDNKSVATGTITAGTDLAASGLRIGRGATTSDTYWQGVLKSVWLESTALTAARRQEVYDRWAQQVIWNCTVAEPTSPANLGGAANVPVASEFTAMDASTWKVQDGPDGAKGRALECQTAGALWRPSIHAYGSWEGMFRKGADANDLEIALVANQNTGRGITGFNGYYFAAAADESVGIWRVTNGAAPSAVVQSAAAYVANATWYRFRATRRYDGLWQLWILGGAYAEWTAIGSASDNNHTTSRYFTLDLDANDSIADLRQTIGVIPT